MEINSAFNSSNPGYHGLDMQREDEEIKEKNMKNRTKKGKETDRSYGAIKKRYNWKNKEQGIGECIEEEGGEIEAQEKSLFRQLKDESREERHQPKNKQLESLARLYKESDKYADGLDSFDYKLKIFRNNCKDACVEDCFMKDALSHMFTGTAR
ncbi:hypothetical protein K3495_g16201, partial [Podosphaera aphanis]